MQKLTELTANIVASHVATSAASATDIPALIRSIHAALVAIDAGPPATGNLAFVETSHIVPFDPRTAPATNIVTLPKYERPPPSTPAVPVSESVFDTHIVCLEDGRNVVLLKRYLMQHFRMTPDEYRSRWNLPSDYPMVAKAYSESKRVIALQKGLGRGVRPAGGRRSAAKIGQAKLAKKPLDKAV